MLLCVVAVRDSAMGMFARPFCVPTIGVAVRSFVDEVNRVDAQGNNPMNVHPEDFELWEVGTFSEEFGEFAPPPEGKRMVSRAKDVMRKESENGR